MLHIRNVQLLNMGSVPRNQFELMLIDKPGGWNQRWTMFKGVFTTKSNVLSRMWVSLSIPGYSGMVRHWHYPQSPISMGDIFVSQPVTDFEPASHQGGSENSSWSKSRSKLGQGVSATALPLTSPPCYEHTLRNRVHQHDGIKLQKCACAKKALAKWKIEILYSEYLYYKDFIKNVLQSQELSGASCWS